MSRNLLPGIEAPVYHWSEQDMRRSPLFGCSFAEFGAQRLAGASPAEIADRTFFEPCANAIENNGLAVLQASINPVTPFHVLSFPHPERVGVIRTPKGALENMPGDGGMVDIHLERAMKAFDILYDWTVKGYKDNPEHPEGLVPAQSVWTANMGRAAALAVPFLHLHHLAMYGDENFYDRTFRARDPNTERFIRPHAETPQRVLRRAFEAQYGTDAVAALHKDKTIPRLDLPAGQFDFVTVERDDTVKPNDFRIGIMALNDGSPESYPVISKREIQAAVKAAYDIQREFKKQGAGGFTMMADVTLLQAPGNVPTKNECSELSIYFATHMDPEKYPQDLPCTKGGYVYAAQKLHALKF